jgi:uncharacterized protein (DUF58 family)
MATLESLRRERERRREASRLSPARPFVPERRETVLPPLPSDRGVILPPVPADALKLTPVAPLDLGLLYDLPSLELRARFVMDGFLAGLHRSPRKGSSVEFAEYRTYQFGDDLRRIDWRLYARTDRLNIKQCEHETQLRVALVFDTSASMAYSSAPESRLTKIDYSRTLLAAIGLLALRQGDAFGLSVVGNGLSDYLKPKSSPTHWRTLLGKLDAMKTGGTTGLMDGVESLAELLPSRSLVIIASDFYGDLTRLRGVLRRLRFDRHEVIALQILDPMEIDFHLESNGLFVDSEDGRNLVIDSAAAREGYLKRFREFLSGIATTVREEGGDYLLARTDASPATALGHYLAERERLL